jgi:hypothetical protein
MMYEMVFLAALLAPVSAAQSQKSIAATSASRMDVVPVWENFEPSYQAHTCPFQSDAKFDKDFIECGSGARCRPPLVL